MKRFAVLLFALMLLLSGCGGKSAETQPTETQAPSTEAVTTVPEATETVPPTTEPPTEPPTEPDPITELLETMTLEEKAGQVFFAFCPDWNPVETVEEYRPGGYLLFAKDFEGRTKDQVIAQIQSFQDASKIPMLIGADEEGGTVVRVSRNPNLRDSKFKSPQNLYQEGGMERILEDAVEKDALLKSLGVNVNFAPVVDIATNPGDFIYARSFGQDGNATAEFTAQLLAQMAQDQVGSVLKHFPGYGANADTHMGIVVDRRPLSEFLENDLLPFRSHIAGEGTTAILMSHNIMTCIDDQLPVSLSKKAHDFLREVLQFDGVIIPDGLEMTAVQGYAQNGNIAVMALLAGNDMLLTGNYTSGISAVIAAVEDGTLPIEVLDTACYRILTWKKTLGLI